MEKQHRSRSHRRIEAAIYRKGRHFNNLECEANQGLELEVDGMLHFDARFSRDITTRSSRETSGGNPDAQQGRAARDGKQK